MIKNLIARFKAIIKYIKFREDNDMQRGEELRKYRRLLPEELPWNLANPIVLINDHETRSRLLNLSPIGIGLEIDGERPLSEGDLFDIKFFDPDIDIQCICVFSEKNEQGYIIGAYFRSRSHRHIIEKALSERVVN